MKCTDCHRDIVINEEGHMYIWNDKLSKFLHYHVECFETSGVIA